MVRTLLGLTLALLIGNAAALAEGDGKGKKQGQAEDEKKPAVRRAVVVGAGGQAVVSPGVQAYRNVPGFWGLQTESVQKELKLSDEQKEKIEEIGKKYHEQMQEGYRRDWAKVREMPAEQRKELYAEMAEKRKRQTETVRKQVEGVLTAKQLDALKRYELRKWGALALRNPRVAEQLDLSDDQQEKLRRNQRNLTEKMQKLQRRAAQQALDVLTPEQLEKLKKLRAEGYRAIWAQTPTPSKPK